MNHLSDEQLSALLDDALSANERAACDAHLAGCDACRARLAEYSAMDASLGKALTHDPGEAYFTDFAERVSARIAAESGAGAAAGAGAAKASSAARKPSPWEWLLSPRGLTLVGSTAALVLVAGIAFIKFRTHDDVGSALREETSSRQIVGDRGAPPNASTPDQAAPEARSAPAPEASSAPAPAGGARLDEPMAMPVPTPAAKMPAPTAPTVTPPAPTGASRAREVKPGGEEGSARAFAAPPVDARLQQREKEDAKSVITQMKRRALQPAQEKVSTRDELQKSQNASGAPAPTGPAPAAATPAAPSPLASSPANPASLALEDTSPLSPCGTVRDTRGHPIAAAQIVALGAAARMAKSGADGRFCLPSLAAGETLSVLRVGYEPLRIVVSAATSMALELEPVGTLTPETSPLARAKDEAPRLTEGDEAGKLGFTRRTPAIAHQFAPAADVYANEPTAIRLAVAEARRTTDQARRERTAKAYDTAADRWDHIGTLTTGRAGLDARFQGLGALREAQRIEPRPARATRLRARLITFLEMAPEALPERTTALRWQQELDAANR